MKRLKELIRLVAMAAASMLLCGFICQAAGGSGDVDDEHIHAYSYIRRECTGSHTEGRHQYVVSTVTHPSGEVEYIYAYCDVVTFFYRYLYKCGCGDQYYTYDNVLEHMNCGQ